MPHPPPHCALSLSTSALIAIIVPHSLPVKHRQALIAPSNANRSLTSRTRRVELRVFTVGRPTLISPMSRTQSRPSLLAPQDCILPNPGYACELSRTYTFNITQVRKPHCENNVKFHAAGEDGRVPPQARARRARTRASVRRSTGTSKPISSFFWLYAES